MLLTKIYKISDHNRLIQQQNRILALIYTSRCIHHKMKIEKDHQWPVLQMSRWYNRNFETDMNIYLECPPNMAFLQKLTESIAGNIDEEFSNSNINRFGI